MLDTPYRAARFVSLIPFVKRETNNQIWHTYHSFVARKCGDDRDHALLLCGLLLGYGIKAYIVIGMAADEEHEWILTISGGSLTFWEPLNGERYKLSDHKVMTQYQTANCIFNNKHFYANIQQDDRVYI